MKGFPVGETLEYTGRYALKIDIDGEHTLSDPLPTEKAARALMRQYIQSYRDGGFVVTGSYEKDYTIKPGNVHASIVEVVENA